MNQQSDRTKGKELSKCIWMKDGLVDYKLCDRIYDCENCLFDRIMRNDAPCDCQFPTAGTAGDSVKILERTVENIKAERFNKDLIYLNNNLVLKHFFTNTFYLGISPLVFNILDCTAEIIDGLSSDYTS